MEIRKAIGDMLNGGVTGRLSSKIRWGNFSKAETGDVVAVNDFTTAQDGKCGQIGRLFNVTVIPISSDYHKMQKMVDAAISDLADKTIVHVGSTTRKIRFVGTASAFMDDTTNRWQRPVEFQVFINA